MEQYDVFPSEGEVNKVERKLVVKTQIGEIIAYESLDLEHPGIGLAFKPDGSNTEIDLAYAEVKQSDYDKDNDNVHVYVYEDCHTDEHTRKFLISKTETINALYGEV